MFLLVHGHSFPQFTIEGSYEFLTSISALLSKFASFAENIRFTKHVQRRELSDKNNFPTLEHHHPLHEGGLIKHFDSRGGPCLKGHR